MTSKPPKQPAIGGGAKSKTPSKRLGRGLSTLLGDNASVAAGTGASQRDNTAQMAGQPAPMQSVRSIAIERIEAGPWQPRQIFEPEALEELAQSIRLKGIIQPILLRPHPELENRYQLIAGERRWRAAQLASLHDIPAIIEPFTDQDASELALIENIQRRDLTAIEEAHSYRMLIETHNYTQDALADIVGKSRSHIANLMRLLNLPASVQDMVMQNTLSMGQVRPLIGRDDAEQLARMIAAKKLSARQVESLITKSGSKGSSKQTAKTEKSTDIKALEKQAQIDLGIRMTLDWQDDAETGTLSLRLTSLDQLDDILARLGIKTG